MQWRLLTVMKHPSHQQLKKISRIAGSITLVFMLVFFDTSALFTNKELAHIAKDIAPKEAEATTAGQMKLYFHKEPSDKN